MPLRFEESDLPFVPPISSRESFENCGWRVGFEVLGVKGLGDVPFFPLISSQESFENCGRDIGAWE
jgi:hypothetical protein